jgi:hypothetical protein
MNRYRLLAFSTAAVMAAGAAQAGWLTRVALSAEGAAQVEAAIAQRGWYCPKADTIERIEIDHRGARIYRIRCSTPRSGEGPSYRLTILPDRRQSIEPWR